MQQKVTVKFKVGYYKFRL